MIDWPGCLKRNLTDSKDRAAMGDLSQKEDGGCSCRLRQCRHLLKDEEKIGV